VSRHLDLKVTEPDSVTVIFSLDITIEVELGESTGALRSAASLRPLSIVKDIKHGAEICNESRWRSFSCSSEVQNPPSWRESLQIPDTGEQHYVLFS
jgi:hypothetical protein